MAEERGRGWRRLVASPLPRCILEGDIIRDLLTAGHVIVACGGGGVAVVPDSQGKLRGVTAIVDKDFTSALLAETLGAELLILSTAVDRVALHYGKPERVWIEKIDIKMAEQYLAQGHFGMGNMGPKVQSAINFLKGGGKGVIITSPGNIFKSVAGSAGTHIVP